MAERQRLFVAVYERDHESDAWLTHIEGIDGCHTYGHTRAQARDRIAEALAAWIDREPTDFVLKHR